MRAAAAEPVRGGGVFGRAARAIRAVRWSPWVRVPPTPEQQLEQRAQDRVVNAALLASLLVAALLYVTRHAQDGAAAASLRATGSSGGGGAGGAGGGAPWVRPSPFVSDLEQRAAAAAAAPPVLQGICDLESGRFEAHFDGEALPQGRAAAAETSATTADEGRLLRLQRAMAEPEWALDLSDYVRRQHSELARRRARSAAADASGTGPVAAAAAESAAMRNASYFSALSAIDELSDGTAISAAAWTWPFTELFPMPSFVSVGEPSAAERGSMGGGYGSATLPPASAFLLSGSRRDAEAVASAATVTAPIHGGLDLANVRVPSYVTRWAGYGDDDPGLYPAPAAAGSAGAHARDSLRRNASAPQWALYLSPQFGLGLTASSVLFLSPGELVVLRSGLRRTCYDLHAGWAGRVKQAAAGAFGHRRDTPGCDVSANYAADVVAAAAAAAAAASGISRGAAAGDSDAVADLRRPRMPYEDGGGTAAAAAATVRPKGVLLALVVDIEHSERGRGVAGERSYLDHGYGAPAPAFGPSGTAAALRYGIGTALPRLASDESYSLYVGERSGGGDAREEAAAESWFEGGGGWGDGLGDDDGFFTGGRPAQQLAALGAATRLAGRVRAHSVWGALHGLQAFLQAAEGLAVALSPTAARVAATGVIEVAGAGSSVPTTNIDIFSSPSAAVVRAAALGVEAPGLSLPWPGFLSDALSVARVAAAHVAAAPAAAATATGATSMSAIQCMAALAAAGAGLDADMDAASPVPATLPLLVLDRPWRPWRGISVDTSRHWLPLTALLALVDGLAASKMNVLHWHFADAQSFPLRLASHPELAAMGAWDTDRTYGAADVERLVRHAAERGVRVVPELDMPAHVYSWSRAHPELLVHCGGLAGGGGIKELDLYALNPTLDATYALIGDIFEELGSLFPDEFLHLGADEVAPECWAEQPAVLAWAESQLPHLYAALGTTGMALSRAHKAYAVLLTHFVARVTDIVRGERVRRRPLTWEDSFDKVHAAAVHRARERRLGSRMEDAETAQGALEAVRRALALAKRASLSRSSGIDGGLAESVLQSLVRGAEADASTASRAVAEGDAAASPSPSAHPVPAIMGYPEDASLQGWKCWVQHADEVLLQAAEQGASEAASSSRGGAWPAGGDDDDFGPRGGGGATTAGRLPAAPLPQALPRGILQSACWYLDWSSPWADYNRHWPLPETSRGLDRLARLLPRPTSTAAFATSAAAAVQWPAVLFAPALPYWGGETAMWTERVDASNLACRTWPRAAVIGEVLWSQSLAYDRLARQYEGQDLPLPATHLGGGRGLPRASASDAVQALFAAPRLLLQTQRLLRRGLSSSPLAIFDLAADTVLGTTGGLGGALRPAALTFEADLLAFNGMCPGIEQAVQRNASRATGLLPPYPPLHTRDADAEAQAQSVAAGWVGSDARAVAPVVALSFATWNLHDGGGSHGRLSGMLARMRELDVDVMAIVEANDWDVPPTTRRGASEETGADVVAEVEPLSEGADERAYRLGLGLGASRELPAAAATPLDTSAHVRAQTAGFRRRAAAAGYAQAHLLHVASGYHLGLLSARADSPLVVVLEDTEHFERGLLVADVAGVRFMVAHLHAQDAARRAVEAAWAAALVRRYSAAALPVVLLGDLNSLSPQDSACVVELATVDGLLQPGAPAYLQAKYLCALPPPNSMGSEAEAACAAQSARFGGGTDAAGRLVPDFRPIASLLRLPVNGNTTGSSCSADLLESSDCADLVDLTLLPLEGALPAPPASAATCLKRASFPTSALGPDADDAGNDNGHVPLRLDFALANEHFLRLRPRLRCALAPVDGHGGPDGKPHSASILELSDHLPLICQDSVNK